MTTALSRRASMFSRILAASVGGYGLTSLAVAALSLALPGGRNVVLLSVTMVSFLLWAAIIMAVFHARSAARAWAWLAGVSVPLGLTVWWLLPGGAVQ